MEIQITTPKEGVNHLTIGSVLCSVEWDIRNSEEFKRELESNPDLAIAWKDSSIAVEQTFAKRTGKFDDPRRCRSFCEFGEHMIDIEQHGGTVCYSHRDLNICARCYVRHVEEYFGVDAPGAAQVFVLRESASYLQEKSRSTSSLRPLTNASVLRDTLMTKPPDALVQKVESVGISRLADG